MDKPIIDTKVVQEAVADLKLDRVPTGQEIKLPLDLEKPITELK